MSEQQQSSVGKIVHYVSHGTPVREDGSQAFASVCRAAIVAEVKDMEPMPENGVPYVVLCVLNPSGIFFNEATYDEKRLTGGSWHWPEHQPGDRPPRY